MPLSVSIFHAAKAIVFQSCDVENALEDENAMAGKEKDLTSATYRAAGNPNMTNCSNQTCIKATNRHYFPKDETLRQKWICDNGNILSRNI